MTRIKCRRSFVAAHLIVLCALAGCQTSNLAGVAQGLEPLPPHLPPQPQITEPQPLEARFAQNPPPKAATSNSLQSTFSSPLIGPDTDNQEFPDMRALPATANAQMTPEEEAALIVNLLSALESQPSLNASEQALYSANQRRLNLIARTHAIETNRLIDAR